MTVHFDIIIRGGLVVDGTGAEPKLADGAISGVIAPGFKAEPNMALAA
jgi:N-acyl-D-aspartate/D-glutamate deacylase